MIFKQGQNAITYLCCCALTAAVHKQIRLFVRYGELGTNQHGTIWIKERNIIKLIIYTVFSIFSKKTLTLALCFYLF